MASLFLSYARHDAARVVPLAQALESLGHQVWWDRHISGGEEFADAIEVALESAEAVVVCWSTTSVHSAWVRDEAGAGRDRGRLVPVSMDGCQPPLGFRQYHTIDLSRWNGRPKSDAIDRLHQAIIEKATGVHPTSVDKSARSVPALAGLRQRQWVGVAAGLLLVLGAAAYFLTRESAGAMNVEPKVAIGKFTLVSPAVPTALRDMVGQEIVAAFGAENAVTVVPNDDPNSAKSPFIMDGGLSRIGDSARFTINLKNQRTGVVLWTGAYEHDAVDAVGARQAAVGASQVVRCGLWGASSYRKPMSDKALSLYFRWCNEHWSGSTSATAELDAARRVTIAVPDFSFGWSALALATVPLAAAETAEADRLRGEGNAAARRSMDLDSQNPEGYMALAGLLPLNRYAEREALLTKALSVRPTECGCERQAYGDFLASVGRLEEAAEQYERARDMRPLAPFSNLRFAQALYMIGRQDEAGQILAATLQLWPEATSLHLLKVKSALWTRRYDEAIALLRSPDLPLTSKQRQALAATFEALKSNVPAARETSVAALERFADDARYNDKLVVGLLAALGAREAALEAAEKLILKRGLMDAEVLFEPNLATARAEPGYAQLVRRLGLVSYWRSARKAPDICRDAAPPDYCSLS